jgi:hypothetical protein
MQEKGNGCLSEQFDLLGRWDGTFNSRFAAEAPNYLPTYRAHRVNTDAWGRSRDILTRCVKREGDSFQERLQYYHTRGDSVRNTHMVDGGYINNREQS